MCVSSPCPSSIAIVRCESIKPFRHSHPSRGVKDVTQSNSVDTHGHGDTFRIPSRNNNERRGKLLDFTSLPRALSLKVSNLLSSADQRVRAADQLSHVQCQIGDFIAEQIAQAQIRGLVADDLLGLAQCPVPFISRFGFHRDLVLKTRGRRNLTGTLQSIIRGSRNEAAQRTFRGPQSTQRHFTSLLAFSFELIFPKKVSFLHNLPIDFPVIAIIDFCEHFAQQRQRMVEKKETKREEERRTHESDLESQLHDLVVRDRLRRCRPHVSRRGGRKKIESKRCAYDEILRRAVYR